MTVGLRIVLSELCHAGVQLGSLACAITVNIWDRERVEPQTGVLEHRSASHNCEQITAADDKRGCGIARWVSGVALVHREIVSQLQCGEEAIEID